jgi:hypothetical protein
MKTIRGYKAYNKGMKCMGFQYEEGKTYKTENAKCCETGFHLCENPLDVLNYYDLCDSEFSTAEATGKIDSSNDDSKIATTKIKIGCKLSFKTFVKCSVDFMLNLCKQTGGSQLAASGCRSQLTASGCRSQLAASGDRSQLAASGYHSQLAASGDNSKLAASGDDSQLAASGYHSQLAASGDRSQLAASGDRSQLAASGDNSKLTASGCRSQLAASGYHSQLAASGDNSKIEIAGKNSVGANIGICGKIKGVLGSWITLAEYDEENKPVCVKSAKIDGKKLKPNVWYKLRSGKFVEV